jgi:hypothetical protein
VREVLRERETSVIVRSSAGCEDQVLQLGVQEERGRIKDLLAKFEAAQAKLEAFKVELPKEE